METRAPLHALLLLAGTFAAGCSSPADEEMGGETDSSGDSASTHSGGTEPSGTASEGGDSESAGETGPTTSDSGQATEDQPPPGQGPGIGDMGLHEVSLGETFEYSPSIEGEVAVCRKDLGHDDVEVDSETGAIRWDTSGLTFGRGFHIRIKCSNYAGATYASMVVHVDNTGNSRLRVAGEDGLSPNLRDASLSMASGDTIVFPDGIYPISTTGDESYENAFKETTPTAGSPGQFSTVIAQTPGGVEITGEAHDGIPTQKNGFQLAGSEYVALVGFISRDALRASFMANTSSRILLDFMGTQGTGTEGRPCSNFQEASEGVCSQAGLRVNGGSPLIQSSYDWGHNRYGIMTRSTEASVTRRSFVRLDEHRGDQPYGGFSDYCDTQHLSQDNTVFDSLAETAPHYKNYAGLSAFPATGCENSPATIASSGLLAVNNDLSLSLMDQEAGRTHVWDHIVSYDSEGTCTPQSNLCGAWLLQADKPIRVEDSFFGLARAFEGGTQGPAFLNADLTDSVVISDIPGQPDQGEAPQYLPSSQLYFRGRSDTFYGDTGYDVVTQARRWPIPGEDIIARNMAAYHNPEALIVGGGTMDLRGDRGAMADGESMSEYFWGYLDDLIPPLVVRVKTVSNGNRVAWEHHSSDRRDAVTGWRVSCMDSGEEELASVPESQLVYIDDSGCSQYAVRAEYEAGLSGIAYVESAS
ncbi:MAG: hypothetical protein KUG77_23485 [Nannocystaceae bacterium]|nr:hypothetical protein [Nannocystaceae bacterium]